jgi:hypothetical protein
LKYFSFATSRGLHLTTATSEKEAIERIQTYMGIEQRDMGFVNESIVELESAQLTGWEMARLERFPVIRIQE